MLIPYNSAAFSTSSGLAVGANASVEVRREDTGALATIYSDRARTLKSNPFNADPKGRFSFYAPALLDGYQVAVTVGAEEHTLRHQLVLPASVAPRGLGNAVAVGDSLTAGGYTVDATNTKFEDRAYYAWASAYLSGRVKIKNVFAASGQNAADMTAEYVPLVLAMDPMPGLVFLCAGGNDLIDGRTANQTITDLQALVDAFLDASIAVVMLTLGPAPGAMTSNAQKSALLDVNDWIRYYATRKSNMILVDAHNALIDGASSAGTPLSGVLQSDNIHYAAKGAQAIGLAVKDALSSFIAATTHAAVASNFDTDYAGLGTYFNKVANGAMFGTAGSNSGTGASGSVADSWIHAVSGTITSVASKVAGADNLGPWQRLTITGAGASAQAALFQETTTGIAAATKVAGACEVNVSAVSSHVLGIYLGIDCQNGSSTSLMKAWALAGNDGDISAYSGILRTPEITVPPGTTKIAVAPVVLFKPGASGGTATVDIRRIEARTVR